MILIRRRELKYWNVSEGNSLKKICCEYLNCLMLCFSVNGVTGYPRATAVNTSYNIKNLQSWVRVMCFYLEIACSLMQNNFSIHVWSDLLVLDFFEKSSLGWLWHRLSTLDNRHIGNVKLSWVKKSVTVICL